jgi:DNA-binding response OmpR family regulator
MRSACAAPASPSKKRQTLTTRIDASRSVARIFAHPNRIIPRDLLLFRLWGGGANQDSRVVDVTVCRLRRALEELGCDQILQTVDRHGYKLALPSSDARECVAAEAS